jgi:ubiquinone/menaquinone biosynthesis C-methylase UbiE
MRRRRPGRTIAAMTKDPDGRSALWARLGARIYDPFLALGEHRGMRARRRALLARAQGRVLELGAGTGLNLAHYPDDVELVLSEPEPAMRAALDRRVTRSGRTARVVAAPAEALPFPDGSFDTGVDDGPLHGR